MSRCIGRLDLGGGPRQLRRPPRSGLGRVGMRSLGSRHVEHGPWRERHQRPDAGARRGRPSGPDGAGWPGRRRHSARVDDDDPGDAGLVAVNEQSWRNELQQHSAMRHAIRPCVAEAATPLQSLGICRLLHQLRARANIPRLITVDPPLLGTGPPRVEGVDGRQPTSDRRARRQGGLARRSSTAERSGSECDRERRTMRSPRSSRAGPVRSIYLGSKASEDIPRHDAYVVAPA